MIIHKSGNICGLTLTYPQIMNTYFLNQCSRSSTIPFGSVEVKTLVQLKLHKLHGSNQMINPVQDSCVNLS
jgi:hypothetical protein